MVHAKMKVFYNWCLFSLLVLLVNGLSIPRGVARKFSTAVDLMSIDRNVGRKSPTVTWKSPTALHVMSIDTGSDNNNATSSTSMAGGYGRDIDDTVAIHLRTLLEACAAAPTSQSVHFQQALAIS